MDGDQQRGVQTAKRLGMRAWAGIGCIVLVIIVLRLLGLIAPALQLVLVGVVVGFIMSPITNALERHHVGRALAAFIALVVVLAVFIAVLALLGPPFVTQLIEVLKNVPSYAQQVQDAIASFWEHNGTADTADVQQSLDQAVDAFSRLGTTAASNAAEKLSSGLVSNVVATVNNIFIIFLGLVLAYWFAKDYPRIARELYKIVGPSRSHDASILLAVITRSMGGYMRGIVITSTVGGLLSFLGFMLIGHPFAGLMGITVGIFHFVPVIGPWLAAALAALLALSQSPMLALASIVVSVIAQNVTDNLVSPLVMQSSVQVHPILSLVGLIVGNSLGGILGMALAIPLTAAIRSVFVYYFEKRTGRQLVSYDGALFKSTPFHDGEGNIQPEFDALDDDQFFNSTLLVDSDEPWRPATAEKPEGVKLSWPDAVRVFLRRRRERSRRARHHNDEAGQA
jgi:predicted PurR-regulated permease PerM